MVNPQKTLPTYAVESVDRALRLAAILQLEGYLTVAEAAVRLGVARSTAHRLLQTLVYRDFAVQTPDRRYVAGPVLELAEYSRSDTSFLRSVALPHLKHLEETVGESVNVTIRTGTEVRFIVSVESEHGLGVRSREGMVFPAHRTSGGLLLLAELSDEELRHAYKSEPDAHVSNRPDLPRLVEELAQIRKQGFAVNRERSERGVVAVGVLIRNAHSKAIAALSISFPSARYNRAELPSLVATLRMASAHIKASLN